MSSALAARRRLIVLGALIAAATVAAFILQPSQQQIEDAFGGDGAVGPLVYAAAYALLTVAFVPGAPLTLAAGALYGVGVGFVVTMIGASLGALGAFVLSRRSSRGALESGGGERLRAIEQRLSGKGLFALLVLRLVPVVPFNALNYAAGVSTIGARDYVIATVLGIVPGALAYTALGAGAGDPASPLFVGAALLAIALAIASRTVSRRVTPDGREGDDPRSESGGERTGGVAGARRSELRRVGWSLAFLVAAVAALGALARLGVFH